MAATSSTISLAAFFDSTQSTSALGTHPLLGVSQGGPMKDELKKIAAHFDGDVAIADARERAFSATPRGGMPQWKRSEAAGIHAEVIIIRAWIDLMFERDGMTMVNAIAALSGRIIVASQPPCWCCHGLMTRWGIVMGDNTLGKKPNTGWRHPLKLSTIPNADIGGSSIEFATRLPEMER